ncbi:MAG TPA: hypothetical protein DCF62_04060 [Porticoccaceae bacterium]|nr:hypothetical protein [Porticoccaceae bacterium]
MTCFSLTDQDHIHRMRAMSAAPHCKALPQWVIPLKLAAQGATLTGVVPWKNLDRLGEAVAAVSDPVQAGLRFFCDDSGYRVVEGRLDATLQLECQRCLRNMTWRLSAEVNWVVELDESNVSRLPKRYDPWLIVEQEANLHAAIEEELLLAMPIVAYHEPEDCQGLKGYSTGRAPERANAFEVLRSMSWSKE